jgi:hypothetical protein
MIKAARIGFCCPPVLVARPARTTRDTYEGAWGHRVPADVDPDLPDARLTLPDGAHDARSGGKLEMM